ncbi:hypothetical protein E2320_011720, partial [Naja naja]
DYSRNYDQWKTKHSSHNQVETRDVAVWIHIFHNVLNYSQEEREDPEGNRQQGTNILAGNSDAKSGKRQTHTAQASSDKKTLVLSLQDCAPLDQSTDHDQGKAKQSSHKHMEIPDDTIAKYILYNVQNSNKQDREDPDEGTDSRGQIFWPGTVMPDRTDTHWSMLMAARRNRPLIYKIWITNSHRRRRLPTTLDDGRDCDQRKANHSSHNQMEIPDGLIKKQKSHNVMHSNQEERDDPEEDTDSRDKYFGREQRCQIGKRTTTHRSMLMAVRRKRPLI